MYKSYLINVLILLCATMILSACVGTTQVKFEPTQELEPDRVAKETTQPPDEEETPKPDTQPIEIETVSTVYFQY